ncbi:hypothetical protein QVD17_20793 [Tagetes erecta]|uniref:Uncharacterized protein n=1 Tax=Tagetes erecta TaxID=13708 RepID=A0AAD8KQK8_TARER|nr:hypothetical protein QVD17_20793 [Tagetes erecta]
MKNPPLYLAASIFFPNPTKIHNQLSSSSSSFTNPFIPHTISSSILSNQSCSYCNFRSQLYRLLLLPQFRSKLVRLLLI